MGSLLQSQYENQTEIEYLESFCGRSLVDREHTIQNRSQLMKVHFLRVLKKMEFSKICVLEIEKLLIMRKITHEYQQGTEQGSDNIKSGIWKLTDILESFPFLYEYLDNFDQITLSYDEFDKLFFHFSIEPKELNTELFSEALQSSTLLRELYKNANIKKICMTKDEFDTLFELRKTSDLYPENQFKYDFGNIIGIDNINPKTFEKVSLLNDYFYQGHLDESEYLKEIFKTLEFSKEFKSLLARLREQRKQLEKQLQSYEIKFSKLKGQRWHNVNVDTGDIKPIQIFLDDDCWPFGCPWKDNQQKNDQQYISMNQWLKLAKYL